MMKSSGAILDSWRKRGGRGIQGLEHLAQTHRHTLVLLLQSTLDGGALLLLGKAIVARYHLAEPVGVVVADVAHIAGHLEGQRVAVAPLGLLAVVVHLPILLEDGWERDALIIGGIGLRGFNGFSVFCGFRFHVVIFHR